MSLNTTPYYWVSFSIPMTAWGGYYLCVFVPFLLLGIVFDTCEVGGFSPYMLGMIFNTREGGGLSFVWLFSLFAVGCRFQHP